MKVLEGAFTILFGLSFLTGLLAFMVLIPAILFALVGGGWWAVARLAVLAFGGFAVWVVSGIAAMMSAERRG